MDSLIPTCKICGAPAMPNTRECITHWLKTRGWDEKTACYIDDPMPFE